MIDTRGIYTTLEELIRLQYKARGYSFLPRQPVHSLLTGRHSSRMRGRGLDFEELRGYLPGDDPRTIDWKVTARVQKPYVRVYTEERDRPALLAVDQRLSMFFGSRVNMKSVTAAEAAALGAWRVTGQGDRIGALVFNDSEVVEIRPHRSQQTVLRILNAIVEQNHALRADSDVTPDPSMLNRVIDSLTRMAGHDYLIIIISDFDGVDGETQRLVSRLARGNDVLAVPVYDPIATDFPERARLVVSDRELQVELDSSRGKLHETIHDFTDQRLKSVLAWESELGVPVLPLLTHEDVAAQVQRLLGHVPGTSRR